MGSLIRRYRFLLGCLLPPAVLFLGVLLNACGTMPPPPAPPGHPKPYRVMGKWYQPLPSADGFRQEGVASWYGDDFHGKRTSSGEVYNMNAMTAAHKTLPLGTVVRVRHLETQKVVTVRINDRGPFVRERVIDLSARAAKDIGILDAGTGTVEIVALGKPESLTGASPQPERYIPQNYFSGNFTIQVGALTDRLRAQELAQSLSRVYKNVHISEYNDGRTIFYRIRAGRTRDLQEAEKYEAYLIQNGFPQAFVVAE